MRPMQLRMFFVIGLLFYTATSFGQELFINLSNGSNYTIDLVELNSITFTQEEMNLNYNDGTVQSWDVGEISFMYYNEDVTSISETERSKGIDLSVYPNPARGRIGIRYETKFPGKNVVSILDASGREVDRILSEEQPAGVYELSWKGGEAPHNPISGSTYFCRIQTNQSVITKKLVLF